MTVATELRLGVLALLILLVAAQHIYFDAQSARSESRDVIEMREMIEIEPIAPTPPVPPTDAQPEIFVIVEQTPEMIPNQAEAMRNLQSSITYPEIAKRAGVEGRVIVQFVVDEQGNVVDPFVVRGIGAGCDEEAVKAVRTLKFKPGKQRGRAVKVQMTLPVTFRLR